MNAKDSRVAVHVDHKQPNIAWGTASALSVSGHASWILRNVLGFVIDCCSPHSGVVVAAVQTTQNSVSCTIPCSSTADRVCIELTLDFIQRSFTSTGPSVDLAVPAATAELLHCLECIALIQLTAVCAASSSCQRLSTCCHVPKS